MSSRAGGRNCVSITEEQQRSGDVEYNYRREEPLQEEGGESASPAGSGEGVIGEPADMVGTDVATYTRERPGMSAFVLEDGTVYQAYAAFARGLDVLWGAYQWLDRAPRGRNESDFWWRRRDEYGKTT